MPDNNLPPEAALISRLRTREGELKPAMPIKTAAARVSSLAGYHFYANKWRRVELGESHAKALDLAWMAYVVGATPTQLEEASRPDAAKLLREIAKEQATKEPVISASVPSELDPETVKRHLQERLEEIELTPGFTEEERAAMKEFLLAQVNLLLQSYGKQIQLLRSR
ncbi:MULTISPECIES: hypothetical protein [Nonomuraea]|uniref:hypothetical protein n=1 Tax=Nonomuraea TaxID=83681 RepID=UPI0033FF3BCC